MSRVAYVNGRYVPHADARVHVEDRGYQFADGVYEVLVLEQGRLLDATLHLDRLERSLAALRITPPIGRAALGQVIGEVAARNRLRSGLIYIQVTRGVARREHAFPRAGTRPALVITMRRLPHFPADVQQWTTSAITWPDERWARCDIKSIALLPNVLARQAAREQGAGEAILFTADGMVTEGAASSVWMVGADGVARTRQLDRSILPGCTRAALRDLLAPAGFSLREEAFSVAELRAAREIFLTSASSHVKPVLKLDGVAVGDGGVGSVTRALFEVFAEAVRKQAVLF